MQAPERERALDGPFHAALNRRWAWAEPLGDAVICVSLSHSTTTMPAPSSRRSAQRLATPKPLQRPAFAQVACLAAVALRGFALLPISTFAAAVCASAAWRRLAPASYVRWREAPAALIRLLAYSPFVAWSQVGPYSLALVSLLPKRSLA